MAMLPMKLDQILIYYRPIIKLRMANSYYVGILPIPTFGLKAERMGI